MYLSQSAAKSTYVSQSLAQSIYVSQSAASSTFLTPAWAASIFPNRSEVSVAYINKTEAANIYLTQTSAAQTYLTSSAAKFNYINLSTAQNTYLTQHSAAEIYFNQTWANSTFLTQANAAHVYLTQAAAAVQFGLVSSTANASFLPLNSPPVWITTAATFPFPAVNETYTFMLQAGFSYYTPSHYTFSIVRGSLPAGLSLNTQTGIISGTTSDVISRSVTFRVISSSGLTSDLEVFGLRAISVTWVTNLDFFPYPQSGVTYSFSLECTDSSAPGSVPIFSIASGQLPEGLVLSPLGVLSGTSTDTSPRDVYIQATSAVGLVTATFFIPQMRALVFHTFQFTAVGSNFWTAPFGILSVEVLVVVSHIMIDFSCHSLFDNTCT